MLPNNNNVNELTTSFNNVNVGQSVHVERREDVPASLRERDSSMNDDANPIHTPDRIRSRLRPRRSTTPNRS
jgi:hypothetical protein